VTRQTFWALDAPDLRLAEEAADTKYERIICPAHAGHQRAGKRLSSLSVILDPLGVRDFTWTWCSDILISPRMLDLFKRHRVTGFEAVSSKTAYPKGIKARPPHLFELVVTGWGGWAAPAAGVRPGYSCSACGIKEYVIAEPSRLIDPAAWDGSDLFIVWPLPGYRFASSRLANILRQEKVSGVHLIPAPRIPVEKGAELEPASIMYCMPEDRARELGQRFGIS
jgi:hypothetical protein